MDQPEPLCGAPFPQVARDRSRQSYRFSFGEVMRSLPSHVLIVPERWWGHWQPSTPHCCCSPPGPKFILVSFIIYAPASILFVMTRREQGRQLFSPAELAILAVSIVGAMVDVVALATGGVSIRAFMTDRTPLRRQARYT